MAESIDELQIEINAKASKANDAIDRLVGKIDRLTTSMSHLDGSRLAVLANGVQRLGTAMQTMNNVKTADFSRLARNLQNLNNLDVSKLSNLSVNIKHIATAFNGLSGMDKSAEQISLLANGIKQLGYKSADKAITNIPLLADAMKKMMAELSTAPRVSRNIIDMTNALAKFARTGSSGGRAANTLVNSFNRVSKASIGLKSNLLSAVNGISAIRRSILSAMGVAGGFYAVFQGIKESINISSDLTEVQNVVDVTFGDFKQKIEDLAKVSIPELGMSELTVKQIASRFQAMGVAMGIPQGKMADMSTELTRLAGDMRSFWNVASPEEMGEDLEAIFTGQTKPLRQYGIDLTEATLQEWAMNNGINANINSMTQLEKTMLRYQYVMANTTDAQGDFLRTQDTWANQIVILIENLKELAKTLGNAFINILKPVVTVLNKIMGSVISFAETVVNALGAIFGWKLEITGGGAAQEYEDAADSADDLASGTGKAADNAKKLKQQLQGIDELNVLSSDTNSGNGGSGSGGGATSGADTGGAKFQITETESPFKSSINTLYQLGEYIGTTITNAMKSIDWNSVYQGAKDFGSGLANFLNGLISPELFGEVGKTIAGSLNTALYALNSFGKTFDWKDFGESIASGINNFFSAFDFANVADTINTWVDGIKTTLVTAIKNIKWTDVIKGAFEFLDELELDTIAIAIGAIAWKYKGKEILLSKLGELLSTEVATGIGSLSMSLGATIGLSVTTAVIGFKIGNWMYDNVDSIQNISDAIAEWITKDGEEIAISKTISVALGGLTIALPIASIGGMVASGTLAASLSAWASETLIPAITTFFATTLPAMLPALTFAAEVGWTIVVGVLGFKLGEKLYKEIPAVQDLSDWIVSLFGDALTGQTLRYDLPFQLGIDATVEDILDTSGLGEIITKLDDAFGNPNSPKEFFVNIKGNIDETAQKIKDWFDDKTEQVKNYLANLKGKIEDSYNDIKSKWDSTVSSAKDWVSNLKGNIEETFNNVKATWDGVIGGTKEWISNLKGNLDQTFTNVKQSWDNLKSETKNLIAQAIDNASSIIDGFKGKWDSINSKTSELVAKAKNESTDVFDKLKGLWDKINDRTATMTAKADNKDGSVLSTLKKSWETIKNRTATMTAKAKNKNSRVLAKIKSSWDSIKTKTVTLSLKFSAMAEDLKKWINDNVFSKINTAFSKVPVLKKIKLAFATGGFPEDGWFRASHGEMIGTFDNGQSVVANNNQITEGISAAVYKGNQENNQLLREEISVLRAQNQLLTELLNKEVGISYSDVGKASQKYAREYTNRTGKPAYI